MWTGPGQDPGGGGPEASTQELSELKDQYEQQQVLIAQLKEMLRKNDHSSVTQENVDEYMHSLSKRGAKVKTHKKDEEGGISSKTLDLPASKKMGLLRQQVEENKARLAERGKNQKGIEEMVTQLKAQLDDSHNLISQNLNVSFQDAKLDYSENSSAHELYSILLTKEKRVSDLLAKVQKLENNVLDLTENVKEKDSVIDARTKAITLMTENLSRKGKTTLDALDDTKEQMRKMQENFVTLENDMKARQTKLLEDLKHKNYEIADLQETNSKLEQENAALLQENAELKTANQSIEYLKQKISELEDEDKGSPQKSGKKKAKKTTNKTQVNIDDLQAQLENSKIENDKLAKQLDENEATVRDLKEEIDNLKTRETDSEAIITNLQEQINQFAGREDNEDLAKLKKQLDESNKNMIKAKAQHKSKLKELTKKIDVFKKISDVNVELVRLEAENCRLNQKVAELEEEKGSLQLKLVETDANKPEMEEDHNRIVAEKDKVISILEADITKTKGEVTALSEKLSSLLHLANAQVSSEMASIRFEEQMDSLENERRQLITINENFEKEREDLLEKIHDLKKENHEISTKLEHYIQENIDLIDKLEKLSAEKVSSAESIEIVEGLTQQEKLELAAYQKNMDLVPEELKLSEENLPQVDLNESVNELTEETSELLQRIELFTVERREVMEKMEELRQENSSLMLKIKEIENNSDVLIETYEQLQTEKEAVDDQIKALTKENAKLKENAENNQTSDPSNNEQVLNDLKQEIDNCKLQLEEKEDQLDNLSTFIKELQDKLEQEEKEKSHLNNTVIDINRTLEEIDLDYTKLQKRVQELEGHNISLNQLLEKSQEELESINNSEWEHQRLIESKDSEIDKLIKERNNTTTVIENLQKQIQEKDENLHKVTSELRDRYLELQKKLEQNSGDLNSIKQPFEAKIEELTAKNKEQLDKMKKIAANLKKKTTAFQELEGKFKEEQEKWEKESSEKESSLWQQIQELEKQVTHLQDALNQKKQEFDQLSSNFNEFRTVKVDELRNFEEKNVELQNIIADLRAKADKEHELNLQQELLQTQENIGEQMALNESMLESKTQELEMIIEEQVAEIARYRERVAQLEEGKSFIEERRSSLERKANELGAELEKKSETCEEMTKSEDLLEQRLQALAAHDDAIEKKWEESIRENQELTQKNIKLAEKTEKLKKKLILTMDKMKEFDEQQNTLADVENENAELKKQIHDINNDMRNIKADFERRMNENSSELQSNNSYWQSQFDELSKDKTDTILQYEKEFNEELADYKNKLFNTEVELKNYEDQIQQLTYEQGEKANEIDKLNQMIENLSSEIASTNKIQVQEKQHINPLSSFFDNVSLDQTLDIVPTPNIEDYKQKFENVEIEKSKLENEIQHLKNQLAQKPEPVNPLSAFFDNPVQTIAGFIEPVHESVKEVKLKLEEVQTEKIQLEAELNQKLTKVENEKVRLEEELAALKNAQNNETIVTEQEVFEGSAPKIMWSEESNDPFAFIQSQSLQEMSTETVIPNIPSPSGNTREELLSKIKTLEFMLYSVEKEKDDALLQCHELTNELTTLIYRNENLTQSQTTNLESQIVSEVDASDTSGLHKIEFENVNPPQSAMNTEMVHEEIIQPKEAYLCFADDATPNPELFSLESQILFDVADTPATHQQLQHMEFEPANLALAQNPQEPMASQSAYLCFENAGGRDTFGENDDGWGLSSEETKLEEDHVQNTEHSPLSELKEKVKVLEREREHHLEEIKQLQIKSSKYIKKLKELKQKNDQLTIASKKTDGDFFNLDDAIQEELKLQMQQIEKKLKETQNDLEKEKLEKAASLKRIDVLTSANERMVEMKEKQDVEMLGWQRNCKDLSVKLEKFEWGDEGFTQERKTEVVESSDNKENNSNLLNRKIQELNATINDLTLDNEELQTLLEEQRALRLNAEKNKSVEPLTNNMKTEAEFLAIVTEKNALQELIGVELNQKKELQDQVNELIKNNSDISDQYNKILKEIQELQALISSKNEIIDRLNNATMVLEQEKAQVIDTLKTLEIEKTELVQKTTSLQESHERIIELTSEKETLFQELQTRNKQIEAMNESVNTEIISLKEQLHTETSKAEKLLEKNIFLNEIVSQKDAEIQNLNEAIAAKNGEIEAIIQQLNQEWELRVDQRGSDVAESWKLHLESRETEFSEIEKSLKKEINDLEAKTIALVNENNELRKNVDAEIRNEVDRVSALQQQINDRQSHINELTHTLQEKHNEFENIQQQLVLKDKELNESIILLQEERQFVQKIVEILPNHDRNTLINDIYAQIQRVEEKENEISDLRQQLDVLTANFTQLQEQTNRKEEEMGILATKGEEYRVQLETLKDNHVLLQQTVADHNHTIANLTELLQQVQNLKEYENENTQNLQQNILDYQRLNGELTSQLDEKSNRLEQVLKRLEDVESVIALKDGNIGQLNLLLEDRDREYGYALENTNQENKIALNEEILKVDNLKKRLLDNENHYEELLAAKDSEIESLTHQLNEQDVNSKYHEEVSAEIKQKDEEISALHLQINDQNALLDEEARQLSELRSIIENQVIKIEELKRELFEKSNDFDSLIAEMDINRSSMPVQEVRTKQVAKLDEEDDLSEPVSRAELDLALYMLHQRDVRCEELTVELTQLLEERDTLQLRLSNALREKEAFAKSSPADLLPLESSITESTGAVPKTKSEIIQSEIKPTDQLATKLSELRTVGYRKDKTFVDEQELRRFQQLSIMQQHRDDASKLPAEAAARLVDASYTLSRDVQSPSKVLLNWLWGRSTPKVNNI